MAGKREREAGSPDAGAGRFPFVVAFAGALAAGALGAFTGCNTDLLGGVLWKTPANRFLLIGAINGVAFGLLLATQRRRDVYGRAGRVASACRSFAYGVAWLLSAAWAFTGAHYLTNAHAWEPARAPLHLDKTGSEAPVAFTADYTGRYELYLDVDRNLPSGDLTLLALGKPDPEDKPAHPDLHRPDIVWLLTEAGDPKRAVPAWQTAAWSGSYWGNTVGFQIGEFEGTAGRTYDIVARIRMAAPPLQALNPRLVIQSSARYRPEAYVLPGFLGIAGMIACVVAVTCLGAAFARWRQIDHSIT